jgi:hypothetical protein
MPRYRVGVVAYATQAYYQEVVVEADNECDAYFKAAEVANERDAWEESGEQEFDGECWVDAARRQDAVEEVPGDTPLTEGADA